MFLKVFFGIAMIFWVVFHVLVFLFKRGRWSFCLFCFAFLFFFNWRRLVGFGGFLERFFGNDGLASIFFN